MRAAKKDDNHNEIRDVLKYAGLRVFETHQLGGGFPDLFVGNLAGVTI